MDVNQESSLEPFSRRAGGTTARDDHLSSGAKPGAREERAAKEPDWPVRAIGQCRNGLTVCLACLARNLATPEQVALLLVDVFDLGEKRAAGQLHLPPAQFHALLHRSRVRLLTSVSHECALVRDRQASGTERERANASDGGNTKLSDGIDRRVVGGGLDPKTLQALRRSLLARIGA